MATNIMVVEDESIVAMDLENRLRSLGYNVVASAGTGEEALLAAESTRPELVLMDVMLRGKMDGIEAARIIHQRHSIPIIFLTAYSDEPTLERAKAAEPFGYILKPFNDRDLRTAIEIGLYKNEVESKLRKIERWLATTLDSMGDAVLSIDTTGSVNFMNPLAESLTGWSRTQAGGKHIAEVMRLLNPDTRGQVDNPVLKALGGPLAMQIEEGTLLVSRDGREIPIDDSAAPVRDESGSVTGGVLVFRDITQRLKVAAERREAEQRERQKQQLEAIGKLAGGVAHDFNNLMTVVLGETQLLLERAADSRSRHSLKMISTAGERAAALTRQLLAYSGKQVLQAREVDVNQLAQHVCGILNELLGGEVQIITEFTVPLPTVHADSSQIQQVLLNIAANAREAMPGGGALTIRTRAESIPRERASSLASIKPGLYVLISMSDNGPGMDAATRARIFEPFFSTKDLGRGLGLAAAAGIVAQSGGTIEVQTQPGAGTTFNIYLPQFENQASVSTGQSKAVSSDPAGHERILVVEDEEILRELIQEILQGFGYHVIPTGSPAEARKVFMKPDTRADLILTDIVMPGETGPELIQDLRKQYPQLKVIFMSAYSDAAVARGGMLTPGSRFIEKPFNPIKLAQLVRSALDE